jgi:hypothetical protein
MKRDGQDKEEEMNHSSSNAFVFHPTFSFYPAFSSDPDHLSLHPC